LGAYLQKEAPGHPLYLFCALSIRYFFSLLSTKKDVATVPCATNPISLSPPILVSLPFHAKSNECVLSAVVISVPFEVQFSSLPSKDTFALRSMTKQNGGIQFLVITLNAMNES